MSVRGLPGTGYRMVDKGGKGFQGVLEASPAQGCLASSSNSDTFNIKARASVCCVLQKQEKPKFVLCVTFSENGDTITGDSSGNILVWGKGNYEKILGDLTCVLSRQEHHDSRVTWVT